MLQQEYIGRNFNAEVGYVPRNGYYKINPQLSYLFFPKKRGRVLSHGPKLGSIYFFNTDFNRTDNQSTFSYLVNFRNQSTFNVSAVDEFVNSWENKGKLEQEVQKFEVWYNSSNQALMTKLATEVCKITPQGMGVPLLVAPDGKCYNGDGPVIEYYKTLKFD